MNDTASHPNPLRTRPGAILIASVTVLVVALIWTMFPRYTFQVSGGEYAIIYRCDRWTGKAFVTSAATREWKEITEQRDVFGKLSAEQFLDKP